MCVVKIILITENHECAASALLGLWRLCFILAIYAKLVAAVCVYDLNNSFGDDINYPNVT